jgi:peroxiredoxin
MEPARPNSPRWMRNWLLAAAVYNLLWGAYAILLPGHYFSWVGIEPPRYLELWQCIGMIVGVYGVGYAIAARDPLRHWPIVLVGLLGKIFGPLGFLWALLQGSLPWSFALTLLSNDLIWWIPFAMILWQAARVGMAPSPDIEHADKTRDELLRAFRTQEGQSVYDRSLAAPQLVVFLRHFGCVFCREALAQLADKRQQIEASGTQLLLVHMGSEEEARSYFERYGLADCARVSDPGSSLYQAFELPRGSFAQLFGPSTWLRGLQATLRGHLVGSKLGDGFQMPGTFLLHRGEVLREFRHRHAGEIPDYCELATS